MNRDYWGILERRLRERTNPWFASARRKKLNRTDFTVISNNCWAGSVYRYFGLPYSSPTEGLYFFGSDYVKFVSDLRHYVDSKLEFIPAADSVHVKTLSRRNELDKVVARLDDIEIVFLHYPTPEEAEEKWKRRCGRINWNNVFIKFSQMNECSNQDLRDFDALNFPNKLCFVAHPMPGFQSAVLFPSASGNEVLNDTDRFRHGFNLIEWLNSEPVTYSLPERKA
ncbi:DUF1919 domain-containing protein [Bifidobacterium adolescentis]|uniref:DUF1919 domain-containing protein n=1 Tax=Bifidobacterium adolescentis TaxID=1680 RepID=UPI001898AB07|nr:DUF1919 domain-containing protein [Bifidobacterium adolescentis]MDB1548174.1 DUF1919 domain-containing protein [Bifidobacterium adolescentis]MDB1557534.1 DUF1919 domain-containing protein [Bifidobacterium adolescentis]